MLNCLKGELTDADNTAAGRVQSAAERKRQRRVESEARRTAARRRSSDSSSSDSSSSAVNEPASSTSKNLAQVIQIGVAESNNIMRESQAKTNRLAALQLILQYGTAEDKAEAMDTIRTISRVN